MFKVDLSSQKFDFDTDPISATSQPFMFIDHYFDLSSSQIKIKHNKEDKWLVVGSDQVCSGPAASYFRSINCNDIIFNEVNNNNNNDNNKIKKKVEEVIQKHGETYYLIEFNGEKHIVTSDIIPYDVPSFYENNFINI